MSYVLFVFPLRLNIDGNTLRLKTKQAQGSVDRPAQKVGRQPVFTEEEEKRLIVFIWLPNDKVWLDRTGRKVSASKDGNFPGNEWANSFLKHYKDILSECMSKNIPYARASTDAEVIDTFFGHLEKEPDGIQDENI